MNNINLKSSLNNQKSYLSEYIKIKYNIFFLNILILLYIFFLLYINTTNSIINKKTLYITKNYRLNKLIKDNFFIIDSNNLDKINSHMYGFSVSRKGILTNNYYKNVDYYEEPEPQGVYIMIRKIGYEIKINQDFSGSFGIYIYDNNKTGYFALSNSFLLLEEYLINKENITLNKEFSDNFIISGLCTSSIYETLINEIKLLPSNSFIIINKKKKEYKIYYINYKEKSIPFQSEEGLKIIDKWIDKWGYILRSLKKQTDNISADLSGGFDSRTILSILLNSGIDMNELMIYSNNNSKRLEEDFKIANNISSKLGFQINNHPLDNTGTKLSIQDSLYCSLYTKLGLSNGFRSPTKFLKKPKFSLTGFGGENIRGYPGETIKEYINKLSKGFNRIFYNSSIRLYQRSISLLTKKKIYYNEYEISTDFYLKGRTRHHFGKTAVEAFLGNEYILSPLLDPDIIKVKYDINPESNNDLITYIYARLSRDLLYFPFNSYISNRQIKKESISKADKLNKRFGVYKIKSNYNNNFYIDIKRKLPIILKYDSYINNNIKEYLKRYFNNSKFNNSFNKVYDSNIYYKVNKTDSIFHQNSLFAVVKVIEDLSSNHNNN